jgi:hypothetical protein
VNIHSRVLLSCSEAISCRRLVDSTRQSDIANRLMFFHVFTERSLYKNAMAVLGRILVDEPHAKVVFGSLELYDNPTGSEGVFPYGHPSRSKLEEYVIPDE